MMKHRHWRGVWRQNGWKSAPVPEADISPDRSNASRHAMESQLNRSDSSANLGELNI
jgi:hypothetical protein